MKNIFPSQVTVALLEETNRNTFNETLGLHYTEVGPDFLRAKLVIGQKHLRPGGIMNGGVSLGVIESVGSVAARCAVHGQNRNTLGIQVSANHLRVGKLGDELTATARVKHLGRSMHVWEVTIENGEGKVVSTGQLTMMVVDKLPV